MSGGSSSRQQIKVLSTNGIRGALVALAHEFERTTSHEVLLDFEVTAVVSGRILAGEAFDVAVFGRARMEELIEQGKIERQPQMTFGRTGMGLGVRRGGLKPDISTPETLRDVLLSAESVAYAAKGGSGKIFMVLLERLGIKDAMQSRIRPAGAPTVSAVTRDNAQFVFTSVGLILADPAAELVAALPAQVQTYANLAIGLNPASAQIEAAREFVRYVTGDAALPVLRKFGVDRDA